MNRRAASPRDESRSACVNSESTPARIQVFALPTSINKTAKSVLIIVAAALLHGCAAVTPVTSSSSANLTQTGTALTSLSSDGYTVVQGNVYLFENTDCPQFVALFGSCFGNNAAAPYIIPQPPIETAYNDPYTAVPFNTPGPNGVTANIFYRLSDVDALVTAVQYPPTGAYAGYQSYMFTSASSNYPLSDPLQVISPNTARYEIFGSVGNDVNNVIVQKQTGVSPWNGQIITFVTTSNQLLANDIVAKLTARGINPKSIMIETLGYNVRTGTTQTSDDLVSLMRYALPEDQTSADSWYSSVANNVLVYKVSNPVISVARYPENLYSPRTGTDETQLTSALNELTSLLQGWSTTNSVLGNLSPVSVSSFTRTVLDVNGIPHGLAGADCISKGTICAGDNQDTSTYAFSPSFALSSNSILFVAGVDHNQAGNSSYTSLAIYNAQESAGIASSSQSNFSAVGFNSGSLTGSNSTVGSAQAVLQALGLYNSASPALKTALPKLYVSLVSKSCTIAIQYCINLNGNTLIPDTTPATPINMYERSYIRPGDTTAADTNVMVYPQIIGPGKQ
jgi:hypothetical protein